MECTGACLPFISRKREQDRTKHEAPCFLLAFYCFRFGFGFVRKCSAFAIGLHPLFTHAPQHVVNIGTWGVSDPAWRPQGRRCDSEAGSLTPILAATPVLRRSSGGTNRRPFLQQCRRQVCGRHGVAAARRPETRAAGTRLESARGASEGGQPRPGAVSPSSAPLSVDEPVIG